MSAMFTAAARRVLSMARTMRNVQSEGREKVLWETLTLRALPHCIIIMTILFLFIAQKSFVHKWE